jgi:type VI secretion system protein ImpG
MQVRDDDLARKFSQEMFALAQEGALFAAEFPEAARFLDAQGLDDRDPYLERITEGVANLTARIRQVAGSEELDQELLAMFAPELVQPLSSVSVVRFLPVQPLVRSIDIPAGAVVRSKPVSQSPSGVPFRLLDPVHVTPAKVEAAKMEVDEQGRAHLELVFGWSSKRGTDVWPDRVRAYLLADTPVVWALRYGLCRKLGHAEVWADGNWQAVPGVAFEAPCLACYTTENDFATPLAKARDFLCVDDRFRFVELRGLAGCGVRVNQRLRLCVHLTGVWPRHFARGISASVFQLHCGVVVNRTLEPLHGIHWDHTRSQQVVRPIGAHREVLEIRSVEGVASDPPHERIAYAPYAARRTRGAGGGFSVVREVGASGEPVLRLGLGGQGTDSPLVDQYLAIDGICGDRDLPHDALGATDVCRPGSNLPPGIGLRGLVRPSASYRMSPAISGRSALLALAQGHTLGWMDAERLKEGLRQVMWDPAAAKRTLIEAIQEVKIDTGFVMEAGIAWRSMDVEIRLRDATCTPDTWDRIGILDAFGSILHAFVQDATEIGSRSRLRMLVEPAGITLDYRARP